MSISKKQKKEIGECLAEIFGDAGSERLMEIYNGGHDIEDEYFIAGFKHCNENDEIGEEIELYMTIALAKKFAKYAGGKFIPHGGIK